MNDLLISFIPALCWSTNTLIEKHYLLKYFTAFELYFGATMVALIPFLIYVIFYNRNFSKKFLNMNKQTLFYLLVVYICGLTAMYSFWYLLQNGKAFNAVCIIHPLYISLTVFLSYLLFSESINFNQFIGFILVISGILVINYNKKK